MKKFLVIGNVNAITYKEVFPLIKENKLWLGVSKRSMDFIISDNGDTANVNACWFTNLDHKKRHKEIILYKKYNEADYPKYDNYKAIEVSKVCDIPMDYEGVMGVPVSFLDKYCPEQFEIVKFRKGDDDKDLSVNGKCPYFRVLIKLKKGKMKKFLIIGNPNAIAYKDFFPYLQSREVFVHSANDTINFRMFFITDSGEIKSTASIWFTNINSDYAYRELTLVKKYDADKYNHLLNYDCINVDKVKDIPYDYDGVMAVPITVMFYNPQQFDIIGCASANALPSGWNRMTKEFIDLYHSQGGTGQYQVGNRLEFYITKDGKAKMPYKRILIRLKKDETNNIL